MKHGDSSYWTVSADLADKTIAAALCQFCAGQSWTQVRRLIETRRVSINSVMTLDDSRRLHAGDLVMLAARPLPPPPDDRDVTVRHLDDAIAVVEKPAGMVSLRHIQEANRPAQWRRRQTSLDEVLLRVISQQDGHDRDLSSLPAKQRRQYLRSVHRIDRDTSGLLVFARTAAGEKSLVEQFTGHTITRTYLTIVSGQPGIGELRSRLIRDRGDGRRGSTESETDGKLAVTHVRHVQPLGEAHSLVRCQLETGRTHQIRIQLSEIGHPVCGDSVYRGPAGDPEIEDTSSSPRLALHASELAFAHPVTGETLAFEMALPGDLQQVMEKLAAHGEKTERTARNDDADSSSR